MNQLTQLYQYAKQLADADVLVNCTRKVDFNKIDLDKEVVFPMFNIFITSGGFSNGSTILFNVQMGVFTPRDINKEINTDPFWNNDNEVDNHNTCIAVLNKIWNQMYVDFGENNITSSENPTFELGYFEKGKLLDGAILTFDVEVPNTDINLCQ